MANCAGIFPLVEASSGKAVAGPTWVGTASSRSTACWPSMPVSAPLPGPAQPASLLDSGAVESCWSAEKSHPFDMAARYRFSRPTRSTYSCGAPRKDLRRFELFLASYFDDFPASFAYVRDGGKAGASGKPGFIEAVRSAGEWQMFPRDQEAVPADSRRAMEISAESGELEIMPRLAAPLALRRDAGRDLTAVLMAPSADCFAVSMPYRGEGHGAVYLFALRPRLEAGGGGVGPGAAD